MIYLSYITQFVIKSQWLLIIQHSYDIVVTKIECTFNILIKSEITWCMLNLLIQQSSDKGSYGMTMSKCTLNYNNDNDLVIIITDRLLKLNVGIDLGIISRMNYISFIIIMLNHISIIYMYHQTIEINGIEYTKVYI